MILLTGATGATGSRLLRRLLDRGEDVRCLVRDPVRLGPRRVAVGLAHWSLTDRRLPRSALRGVDTIVHVAGPLHDEPGASLEELNVTATWRLVDAAASAGVGHVVVVSALGSGGAADCRFLRAKRAVEEVVRRAGVPASIVAPSLVLAPGGPWAWTARVLATLPLSPVPARSTGRSAPVAASDVAEALAAVVAAGPPEPPSSGGPAVRRVEAAGPEVLALRRLVPALQAAQGRARPAVPLPAHVLRTAATILERPGVVDREELFLLRCDTTGRRGTDDLTALGIRPRTVAEALAG